MVLSRKIDHLRSVYDWKCYELCMQRAVLNGELDTLRIQIANFTANNGQTRQNLHSEILQKERALDAIEIQIVLAEKEFESDSSG